MLPKYVLGASPVAFTPTERNSLVVPLSCPLVGDTLSQPDESAAFQEMGAPAQLAVSFKPNAWLIGFGLPRTAVNCSNPRFVTRPQCGCTVSETRSEERRVGKECRSVW